MAKNDHNLIFPFLFSNKGITSTGMWTVLKTFFCVEMISISYHHTRLKKEKTYLTNTNTIFKIPFFHLYTSALYAMVQQGTHTDPMLSYLQFIQNVRFKPYNSMPVLHANVFGHFKNFKWLFYNKCYIWNYLHICLNKKTKCLSQY